MKFNDFFHTDYCKSRANAIISDNRQAIVDSGFDTAQEYMTDNIVNFEYEIYN